MSLDVGADQTSLRVGVVVVRSRSKDALERAKGLAMATESDQS